MFQIDDKMDSPNQDEVVKQIATLLKYRNEIEIKKAREDNEEYKASRKIAMDYLEETLTNVGQNRLDLSEISADNCEIVYFDLETSGFHMKYDEILQIAAKCNEDAFNVYIKPTVSRISGDPTRCTGFSIVDGDLYCKEEKLDTKSIAEALSLFSNFLKERSKPVLLVAHKTPFDIPRLLQAILNNQMVHEFNTIVGSSDTLELMKKQYPERVEPFKLQSLAASFLNVKDESGFHSADYDVAILQQLIQTLDKESELFKEIESLETSFIKLSETIKLNEYFSELKKVVSDDILKRMIKNNYSFDLLLDTYKNQGEKGLRTLLTKVGENGKPAGTKNQKSLQKIVDTIKLYVEAAESEPEN